MFETTPDIFTPLPDVFETFLEFETVFDIFEILLVSLRPFLMDLRTFCTYLRLFLPCLRPFIMCVRLFLTRMTWLTCFPTQNPLVKCLRPFQKYSRHLLMLTDKCNVLHDYFEILPVWFERIQDAFQLLPLS